MKSLRKNFYANHVVLPLGNKEMRQIEQTRVFVFFDRFVPFLCLFKKNIQERIEICVLKNQFPYLYLGRNSPPKQEVFLKGLN